MSAGTAMNRTEPEVVGWTLRRANGALTHEFYNTIQRATSALERANRDGICPPYALVELVTRPCAEPEQR